MHTCEYVLYLSNKDKYCNNDAKWWFKLRHSDTNIVCGFLCEKHMNTLFKYIKSKPKNERPYLYYQLITTVQNI